MKRKIKAIKEKLREFTREPELVGVRKNKVKIVSYGTVSSVYPEPSIKEVEEIKMVRTHLRFTRMVHI